MDPIITWYVREEESFNPKSNHDAGVFTRGDLIEVEFQIWNNRYGEEDVDDLHNATLNFYFNSLEDSSLLKLCKIIVNDIEEIEPNILGNKASVQLGVNIIGKSNSGIEGESSGNFVNIKFTFNHGSYIIKENDLKSLYFEVI